MTPPMGAYFKVVMAGRLEMIDGFNGVRFVLGLSQ